MTNALRYPWVSIVVASLSVWVTSGLVVTMAVIAHAFRLGWAARGAPDQVAIQQFADRVGPEWGPIIAALLTGIASFWISRRAMTSPARCGLLLGLVVAVVPLAVRARFDSRVVVVSATILLVGALGGWLGGRFRPDRNGKQGPGTDG
jgi:hypothetical protein